MPISQLFVNVTDTAIEVIIASLLKLLSGAIFSQAILGNLSVLQIIVSAE